MQHQDFTLMRTKVYVDGLRLWTGHSPIEYVRRLRVEQARQLLADVDLSTEEIATRCGFDEAYHFSRTFRQIDGLPPTKYREIGPLTVAVMAAHFVSSASYRTAPELMSESHIE